MSSLVDRWLVALFILTALLAATIPASFRIQQDALDVLNAGVSSDQGPAAMIAYGRISAEYFLLNQATPVLILATGLGVVALLVLLSRRWNVLENQRVRDAAEA